MASNRKHGEDRAAAVRRPPEWADGLKQLYDSVVEEDLPDSFRDLLDQLDQTGPVPGGNSPAGAPAADHRGARR